MKSSPVEYVFAEELALEACGGPDALHVRDHARYVFKAVHEGAALAPDDAENLTDVLGDPQAFVNEPTEPADLRENNRLDITGALLIHACRTGDPGLVRRLRQVSRSEIYRIGPLLPIPAPCLLALFADLGQEELPIRHAAMYRVRNIHLQSDVTPILDIIISELGSPERRRGLVRKGPAAEASLALIAYSLSLKKADGLCERVAAAINPSAPAPSALRTLAALYAVAEQFDRVTSLVGQASTRAEVIGGLYDAISAIAWNLENARPVPNARYPFDEAVTLAEGLATNAGHRKHVLEIHKRLNRFRFRKATFANSPSAT
ncbi:hypothetical protein [Streptomyces sp. NBC_01443]|uniref:hypothetical protein n=1 Tax=Streptomyces sp. NBC_01443 TaxID=2903868 RepID=UPI0022576901|nr:hypothetical protein [Streptomyces sp. NBC_01443]MCX4633023.1 hypothetical protein [Streptomyces sp. NBC_01443]